MAEIKFKTEWLTQIALLAACGTADDVADLCTAIMRASQGLPINEMGTLTETLFHPIAESINEDRTKSERNRTNRQGKRYENERSLKEKEKEREAENGESKEASPHTPLEESKEDKGEERDKEKEYIYTCEDSTALSVDVLPAPGYVPETDPKKMTDTLLEHEFDALWMLYPRKAGKADALRHYKAARRKGVTYEAVEAGIKRYADYVRDDDPQFIAMGSTWFNGHRWEDQYVRKKSDLERLWDL